MSNPFDQFDTQPDVAGMVTAAAQRHGVDPALAMRVARQESGLRTDAVSPKGARGPMQLMPATARELGVDPDDPEQNIDGGVRYLRQQLDDFGTPELALAAYNAGPGNVRKYGGVPPFAETQNYVQSIAGDTPSGNPFDQFDGAAAAPEPQGGVVDKSGGVSITLGDEPDQAGWTEFKPDAPSVLEEAASGFAEPLMNLGRDALAGYQRKIADATAPLPSPGEAVSRSLQGLSDLPRLASGALAAAGAPLQAVVRPVAGAVSRALPTPHKTHVEWRNGIPHQYVDGKMTPEEARSTVEGGINTALSAARAPGVRTPAPGPALQSAVPGKNLTQQVRAVAPQMPVPVPKATAQLGELQAAKTAAYKRVDSLGASYTGKAKADLKKQIVDGLTAEGIDQGANPGAYSAMKRAETVLTGKKPVTLTDLDNLRQTAWRQAAGLKGPDKEAERYYGQKLIEMIDRFVDTAQPGQIASGANPQDVAAAIREARAANQRYKKVQTVTNELDSAQLRASSTYAGGNKANAIRQELRPLVDPTSNRRMRGISKAEEKALRRVVHGSPLQNAVRVTGKVLDPRGLVGASLQGALGLPSAGMSTLGMIPGVLASEASNAMTMRSVDKLLKLLAGGGKAVPKRSVSPRGLIGGSVLAAPAARQEDRRPSERKASR